ncbi:hypothetical protein MGG_15172 [Pyricularia oryzae 70-15]|uniref:Uncharacterized protein n=3 Tax=Pyricularia oryzae TaxID=318829 RepID=G4MQB9_PYRO7|nr:uncharacterized protein MGG_15172 [Pyricularia oryzae 70-15]EHA58105.1 hypothetical protein MGG_15172 [Pyricularia oryzae 70-15]ELQ39438.1 hypothetical protein OOU_Y34scaffold00498g21 [Pyricularia oryzae Y34]
MSCRQTTLRIDRPGEPCCNGGTRAADPRGAMCWCHKLPIHPRAYRKKPTAGQTAWWLLIGSTHGTKHCGLQTNHPPSSHGLVQCKLDGMMYRPSPLELGDSRARRHTSPGPSSVRQVSKRVVTNVLTVPGHGRVAVADHNRTLGVFCGTRTAVQLDAKLPWPMLEP